MRTLLQLLFAQYKQIIKNSVFLIIIDGIKLLLPFIAMPYIIRVCGVENYGKILFAQSVVAYFSIIVNFGLNIFTVREVAVNSHSVEKLSRIASSYMALRLILIMVSFIALCLSVAYIPFLQSFKILMLYCFIGVAAEAFAMSSFYQGMEKIHNTTVFQTLAVLFYIFTLVIFVRRQEDYELVPLLQSIGLLLSGVMSLLWLCFKYKIRIRIPVLRGIKSMFMGSIPFAMSRIAMVVNGNVAKLFAGIALGMSDLAVLGIAEKIADAAMLPVSIVDQAVYPHNSKTQDRAFATKTFIGVAGLGVICALLMIAGTPLAVRFFGQGKLNAAIPLTMILSTKIVFNAINYYTGTPVLVAFGHPRPFNMSIIYGTLFTLLIYPALYFTGCITLHTVILTMILDAVLIASYRMYYCLKYKLLFIE